MIDPRYYGLIELLLFGALALGFGAWQLISINRTLKEGRDKAESKEKCPTDGDSSGR
jgi:hypothetical protein